jgi:tetratricopeptide (TPR) repeat protein
MAYLERNPITRRPGEFEMAMADLKAFSGNHAEAQRLCDSARVILQREIQSPSTMYNPDASANARADLAVAYAVLGMKAKAIKTARSAFDHLNSEYNRSQCDYALARVYALSTEPDSAIAILERLVKGSSFVTEHTVRLDPAWTSLRDHPRFKKLIASGQPAS